MNIHCPKALTRKLPNDIVLQKSKHIIQVIITLVQIYMCCTCCHSPVSSISSSRPSLSTFSSLYLALSQGHGQCLFQPRFMGTSFVLKMKIFSFQLPNYPSSVPVDSQTGLLLVLEPHLSETLFLSYFAPFSALKRVRLAPIPVLGLNLRISVTLFLESCFSAKSSQAPYK